MHFRGQADQKWSRLRGAKATRTQRKRQGFLLERLGLSQACGAEAVSWMRSFLVAALLLCGLYGSALWLLSSSLTRAEQRRDCAVKSSRLAATAGPRLLSSKTRSLFGGQNLYRTRHHAPLAAEISAVIIVSDLVATYGDIRLVIPL